MRLGQAWRHTDFNGDINKLQRSVTLVELIPVKPAGWMIFEGGQPLYGKLIFDKLSALAALEQKCKGIASKKKFLKIDDIMWEELPHVKPVEREAPDGAFPIRKNLEEPTTIVVGGKQNILKQVPPKEEQVTPKDKPRKVLKGKDKK